MEAEYTFQDLMSDVTQCRPRIGRNHCNLLINRYGEENRMEALIGALHQHRDKCKIRVLQLEYCRWDYQDFPLLLEAFDGAYNLTHIFLTHCDGKVNMPSLVDFILRNGLRLKCLDVDTNEGYSLKELLRLLDRNRKDCWQLFCGHPFGQNSNDLQHLLDAVRGTTCYVVTDRLLADSRHLWLIPECEKLARNAVIAQLATHNREEAGFETFNNVRMGGDP